MSNNDMKQIILVVGLAMALIKKRNKNIKQHNISDNEGFQMNKKSTANKEILKLLPSLINDIQIPLQIKTSACVLFDVETLNNELNIVTPLKQEPISTTSDRFLHQYENLISHKSVSKNIIKSLLDLHMTEKDIEIFAKHIENRTIQKTILTTQNANDNNDKFYSLIITLSKLLYTPSLAMSSLQNTQFTNGFSTKTTTTTNIDCQNIENISPTYTNVTMSEITNTVHTSLPLYLYVTVVDAIHKAIIHIVSVHFNLPLPSTLQAPLNDPYCGECSLLLTSTTHFPHQSHSSPLMTSRISATSASQSALIALNHKNIIVYERLSDLGILLLSSIRQIINLTATNTTNTSDYHNTAIQNSNSNSNITSKTQPTTGNSSTNLFPQSTAVLSSSSLSNTTTNHSVLLPNLPPSFSSSPSQQQFQQSPKTQLNTQYYSWLVSLVSEGLSVAAHLPLLQAVYGAMIEEIQKL